MIRRMKLTPAEIELIEKHRQRNAHIAIGLQTAIDIIQSAYGLTERPDAGTLVEKLEAAKKDLQS